MHVFLTKNMNAAAGRKEIQRMQKAIIVNHADSYDARVQLVRRNLIRNGYTVTVFTGDFRHREKCRVTEKQEGYVYAHMLAYQKNVSPARILSLLDFSRRASGFIKREKPDLLYVMAPANSTAYVCAGYKRKHPSVTLVVDVIDLWPETMPVPQSLKKLPVFKLWASLRTRALEQADTVLCECALFAQRLKTPSVTPAALYMPALQMPEAMQPCFDADCVQLGYLGSVNHVIDIARICDLVRAIAAHKPVCVHIVGGGERLEEFCSGLRAAGAQVVCHGMVYDAQEKQRIFDACRFGINIMRQETCVGLTMKSVDYLRMGVPLINGIGADTAQLVAQFDIGIDARGDVDMAAAQILQTDASRDAARRTACRMVFDRYFTAQRFDARLDVLMGFDLQALPPVRVLLAAYNGASYLRAQLDSLLAQDYGNVQVIVSDDGSTDETSGILDEYAAHFPQKVTRYHAPQRFGNAQDHFMHLLHRFSGEGVYCMFCDQDDVWDAHKVSVCMQAMRRKEAGQAARPILVHTDLRVVDASLRVIDESFMHYSALDPLRRTLAQFLVQNVVTGCTMLLNPALCRVVCDAPVPQQMLMHDWWIALAAAALGCVVYVPRATISYRQHGKNSVGAKDVRSLSYARSRIAGGGARAAMDDTMHQAEAFADAFAQHLSDEALSLCRAYAACRTKGRFARSMAFLRLGTLKCGYKRIAAQLLLG